MTKSSALRVRIEPSLHKEFIDVCKKQNIPASQVLRIFMRSYIENYSCNIQFEIFDITSDTINIKNN